MKRKCTICGESFQTERSKLRHICNDCYCYALDEGGYYDYDTDN